MISFSKRFIPESGPYLRTRASRATITGLRAPDFTTMDVDWGPWTVLAEIASRDDPGPVVGLSSRLNASSGPQRSGGARPRHALTVPHPYQALSAQIGMSWRVCVDNLFCAILRDLEHLDAVCSEANSKSVFGLSQRTLNFGIWMLLSR